MKRSAISDDELLKKKLYVDQFLSQSDACSYLLNFQNGYTNKSITKSKCCLMQDKKEGTKCVAVEVNQQVYFGEAQREPLGRTFLLTRHRKTGEVKLIETSNVSMKPVLHMEGTQTNIEKTTELELSRKFGSKKSRKNQEQKEKLKTNLEVVKKQMSAVAANVSADQIDLKDYNEDLNEDFYVPKMNRDAERVNQVYTFEAILSDELFDTIYAEIEDKDYKKELAGSMQQLMKKRTLTNREIVMAMYYSCLLKIHHIVRQVLISSTFNICDSSPTLHHHVLTTFTKRVPTSKQALRPPAFRDKEIGYALVIALLLNDYTVNIRDFSKEWKLSPRTMCTKCQVTGATLEKVRKEQILRLKLPLAERRPLARRRSSLF